MLQCSQADVADLASACGRTFQKKVGRGLWHAQFAQPQFREVALPNLGAASHTAAAVARGGAGVFQQPVVDYELMTTMAASMIGVSFLNASGRTSPAPE